jgi:hypothetical protein
LFTGLDLTEDEFDSVLKKESEKRKTNLAEKENSANQLDIKSKGKEV